MRRTLVYALLIVLCWSVFLGASDNKVGLFGSLGGQRVGLSNELTSGAKTFSLDTVSILIRDANLPNTASADSGFVFADEDYDTIIGDTDGTYLRWGCTTTASPDAPYNNSGLGGYTDKAIEDDRSDPIRTTFIWGDISSIPSNVEILDARLCFSIQKFSTVDFTNGYVAARADTHYADYAMIDSASTVTPADPNFLATTFNSVDGTNAWTFGLGSRDDWHDFGPRGTVNDSLGSQAQNTAIQVDFTNPLQQIIDAGTQGRGIILVPYVVGTNASNLRIAMGPDAGGYAPTGNPCLTITYATRRGTKPWYGVEMPVVVTLDDADTSHVYFGSALEAAGHSYTEMFCGTTMAGGASRMSQAQIDAINDNPLFDVGMHGRNHTGLGNAADTDELDYWLYRDWTASALTTPRDTTAGYYRDFAYPADGTFSGTYSLPALSRLVEAGYRSARAAGDNGWTGIGRENNLAWDGFVNVYMVGASSPTRLFGTSTPFTDSKISDEFGDMVDEYYTDRLKSPLIFYWHDVLTGGSYANSGVNYDQFDYFISVVDSASACDFRNYGEVVRMRTLGQQFISPADVTVANGATTQNETSAAIHDSVWTADGDDNFLGMWLAPWSRLYSYSTAIDTEAPLPPSGLIAIPGDDQVVLSWTASGDKAIVQYNVYRYFDGGVDTTLVKSGVINNFYPDTDVYNGAHYNYFVSASDLAGNESYDTSHVSAVPVGALSMSYPSYFAFHYDQNPSASPATAAQLDSLAAFDAVVFGAASMLGNSEKPFYTGMRDSLVSRNPDMMLLNYIIAITPKTVWASYPAGSAPRRSWDFLAGISDSLGFGQNLSGFVVESDRYPTLFTNVMTAAYADTLARYWVDDFEGSEVDGPFSGFFVDLVDSTLGTHLCNSNACIDVMDYDQDGTQYSADADEKVAFKEFQMTFLRGLRREMGERGMGDRLVVINGPLVLGDAEAASYADGYLVESWNKLKPGPQGSESAWDDAIAAVDNLVNSQTNPPLVLWSSEIDSSMAYIGEPVALAAGGAVHVADAGDRLGENAIPAMVRRLPNPGSFVSYSAANDTLVAEYSQYTAYLDINHTATDTFGVWPYFIVSGTDTISRGGGWPRQMPAPIVESYAAGDGTIEISWNEEQLYAIPEYDRTAVYRSASSDTTTLALFAYDRQVGEYWSTNATNDSTYYYSLKNLDLFGNESAFSEVIGLTPSAGNLDIAQFSIAATVPSDTTAAGNVRPSVTISYSGGTPFVKPMFRRHDGTYADWADTSSTFWLNPAAADWSGLYDTGVPIATASEDSGAIRVTWDAGTGHTGYLLQMSANGGSWVTVDGSVSADSTGFTHQASDSPPPERGELRYRLYGYNSDPDTTAVATHDSLFYNQAVRVYGKFLALADSNDAHANIVETTETSALYISYPPPGAPDTTPPDTTGVFAAVAFDTTDTDNVIVTTTGTAAENVQVWHQWKNAYDGTWTPAERWQPMSYAAAISDSIGTLDSTATLDGDTVYVRVKMRDISENESAFIGASDGNWVAKVFTRAVPAADDTVGYGTIGSSSSSIGGSAAYGVRIVADANGSCVSGSVYLTVGGATYNVKAALYDASFNLLASGTLAKSGDGANGWHTVTFSAPTAITSGTPYILMFQADTSGISAYYDTEGAAANNIAFVDTPGYASFPDDPMTPVAQYDNRRYSAYVTFE